MSLALCHGPSKSYEQVESGGNKSMIFIHQVMGRKRASDIFKKSKKTPKINLKQSMHTQSPTKQTSDL